MGDIVLLLILAGILLMNIAATILAGKDEYSEPRQRVFQVIFVWVVPILGALLVLGIHRKAEKPSRAYRAADSGGESDLGSPQPLKRSIGDLFDGD